MSKLNGKCECNNCCDSKPEASCEINKKCCDSKADASCKIDNNCGCDQKTCCDKK